MFLNMSISKDSMSTLFVYLYTKEHMFRPREMHVTVRRELLQNIQEGQLCSTLVIHCSKKEKKKHDRTYRPVFEF